MANEIKKINVAGTDYDVVDATAVHKAGDETVSGSKTFSSTQYFEDYITFDTTNGDGYLGIVSGGHFQIASGTGDLYLVGDSDVKLIGSAIKTENNFKFYTGAEDAEKGVIFGINDGSGNVDYGSLSAFYHGANSLGIVTLNSTGNLDLEAIKGVAIKSGISTSSALPSYYAYLNTTALTATRTFAFPNKAGTFAMTSDIPDISGKVNKSGDTMTGTLNMSDADIYFSGSDFPGICFNSSSDNRIWYDPDSGGKIALMTDDSTPIYLSSSGIELETTHLNLSGTRNDANGVEMYSTAGIGCTTYICSGASNASQSIKFGANSSGNFVEFADFTYTYGETPTYKLTVNSQFITFGSSGITGSNSFPATSSTLTTSGKISANTFIYSQLCTIYGLPSSSTNYVRVYESTSSSSTTGGALVAVAQGGYYSASAVGDCRVTFRMKPGYYYYVVFSGLKYYSGTSASSTGVSIKRWPDM